MERGNDVSPKRKTPNELKNKHDSYIKSRENEINAIQARKKDEIEYISTCLTYFSNPKDQKNLIKSGKKLCYSPAKLKEIEKHFTAWNMDDVDINTVEDIYELQIFIDERTNGRGFIDRIYNIFHDDEGDDDNGI